MNKIALYCFIAPLFGQTYTTVTDTIYLPVGLTTFAGTIEISAPALTYAGVTYARQTKTYTVTGGAFSEQFVPNDAALPANTTYMVRYFTPARQAWTETWTIPTSTTPLRINQVRTSTAPAAGVVFPASQINLSMPFSLLYGNSLAAGTALAPNTAATRKYLSQTGDGINAAAPQWVSVDVSHNANDYSFSQISGTAALSQINLATPFALLYGSAQGVGAALAPNTTTTRKYLAQTGDGTNSSAPAWVAVDVSHNANDYSFPQISGIVSTAQLPSGIPATKLGAGLVDDTHLGYLSGVTSSIQTQFDGKISGTASPGNMAYWNGAVLAGSPYFSVSDGTSGFTMTDVSGASYSFANKVGSGPFSSMSFFKAPNGGSLSWNFADHLGNVQSYMRMNDGGPMVLSNFYISGMQAASTNVDWLNRGELAMSGPVCYGSTACLNGTVLVVYELETAAACAAGTATLQIGWTSYSSTYGSEARTFSTSPVDLTALHQMVTGTFIARLNSAQPMSFALSTANTSGACKWSFTIRVFPY